MLIFIDESGDAGFKLQDGATSHFVIVMVIFSDALEAEKAAVDIKTLRRELGFPDHEEFKFFRSKDSVKRQFLEVIRPRSFTVRAMVVEKVLIKSEEVRAGSKSFYSYFIKAILKRGKDDIRNAKVWVDGIGDRGFRRQFATYLRRELRSSGRVPAYADIRFVDSKANVLIQMADMIAGAVLRKYAKEDDAYYKIIKVKITDEWRFR